MGGPYLLIAVPTYRRPEMLARLIGPLQEQLAECRDAELIERGHLLVVDNDPARSAESVVRQARGSISYRNEPIPGIAAVRNAALDEAAGKDLLAFIDDDELPEPGWLRGLVSTWRATGATLVAGRVIAHFEKKPDPWIEAGRFFVRRQLASGAPLTAAAAGNLLLDVEKLRSYGIRFSTRMSLSGGEDTLFSKQLHRAGALMVWAADSAVLDLVPADRATRSWVLARARSHGNSAAAVDLVLSNRGLDRWRTRLRLAIGGLGRVLLGLARAGFGALTARTGHHARGSRAANRGAGMIIGAVGLVYREYAREGDRRWVKMPLEPGLE